MTRNIHKVHNIENYFENLVHNIENYFRNRVHKIQNYFENCYRAAFCSWLIIHLINVFHLSLKCWYANFFLASSFLKRGIVVTCSIFFTRQRLDGKTNFSALKPFDLIVNQKKHQIM